MSREAISKALNDISTRHVEEAQTYTAAKKKTKIFKKPFVRPAIAAIFMLCFLAGGIRMFFPLHGTDIRVYAYGTDDEITAAGAVIHTGTISDSGEMSGHPLMFYLLGSGIKSVRFSCKNQQLQFRDWTEQRDEFGLAQNFTVPYGENESEYYYLTIDWEPKDTIQKLTDYEDSTIKTLPDALKEDLIVMEVAFANGKTAVKAISISLWDDGNFFARLDDYQIKDTDAFVNRKDALTLRELSQIRQKELEENSAVSEINADPEAVEAAKEYYSNSVFEVVSMEVSRQTKTKIIFSVCVSKDGVIQDPDRRITLKLKHGIWKVIGEGY